MTDSLIGEIVKFGDDERLWVITDHHQSLYTCQPLIGEGKRVANRREMSVQTLDRLARRYIGTGNKARTIAFAYSLDKREKDRLQDLRKAAHRAKKRQ